MTDLVQVWIVPVDVPAETARQCWAVLDDDERARADEIASSHVRQRFAVAHGVLRILVGRALEVPPAAIGWIAGRYGKPELAAPWSRLHTSLSHSGELVAVAISDGGPVGVDIQRLVPGLDTVAMSARFFDTEEASYVAAGDDVDVRADRFAHLWARKEAVVKAAGGRLWANLGIAVRGRDVVSCLEPPTSHRVADVAAPPRYRAAVALTSAAPFTLEAADWPGEPAASTVGH